MPAQTESTFGRALVELTVATGTLPATVVLAAAPACTDRHASPDASDSENSKGYHHLSFPRVLGRMHPTMPLLRLQIALLVVSLPSSHEIVSAFVQIKKMMWVVTTGSHAGTMSHQSIKL